MEVRTYVASLKLMYIWEYMHEATQSAGVCNKHNVIILLLLFYSLLVVLHFNALLVFYNMIFISVYGLLALVSLIANKN